MARKKLEVNKVTLQRAVEKAEENGSLSKLSELYEKVAENYNLSQHENITSSIVGLRIKEYKIETKTKPGKRGREKMTDKQKAAMQQNRTSKAEKFSNSPVALKILNNMRKDVPERFQSVVEKVTEGSRTAAVKLKCLECSGYQTPEVRHCTAIQCPLWLFRPYQGKINKIEELEEDQQERLEVA